MMTQQPIEIGQTIVANLPGERIVAEIRRVIDGDTVIAEITAPVMSKTHQYKTGGVVALRRTPTHFGDAWDVYKGDINPPIKRTNDHAAQAGEKSGGRQQQHPRVSPQRTPTTASGSHRIKRGATVEARSGRRNG